MGQCCCCPCFPWCTGDDEEREPEVCSEDFWILGNPQVVRGSEVEDFSSGKEDPFTGSMWSLPRKSVFARDKHHRKLDAFLLTEPSIYEGVEEDGEDSVVSYKSECF